MKSRTKTKRPNSNKRPGETMRPKSSKRARSLIRSALQRCRGNQSAAARLLGLPNQAQLRKMLRGEIGDTPAMRAALERADTRAKRAWGMVKGEHQPEVDRSSIAQLMQEIETRVEAIRHLLTGHKEE